MTYKCIYISKKTNRGQKFILKMIGLAALIVFVAGINWFTFQNQDFSESRVFKKEYIELIKNNNITKYTNSLAENINFSK